MAEAAQRDLDTISNMSGDTFLLGDLSDSEVPPSESQNVLLSQSLELPSEPQTAEQQAVSAPGNISYAAAAADNTPRVSENPRGYRGEQYLTRFEKENFHPDNVTPERPCTAYFQASIFADSAAVFDALKTQGFVASSIRCLQRRPTGEMLITFSSVHMKNAFMEKNSIQIHHRRFAINDSDRFLTYLNVYDAPHEMSDAAIIRRLEPYCEVVNYRRGRYLSNRSIFNGNRHYRVRVHSAIPSYLRFGKFLVRLSHDGQEHTCRKCNRRGHFANNCENTICFNCEELGHVCETCPHQELCCICKEPSHRARFCPYSWFRQSSPASSPARDPASEPIRQEQDQQEQVRDQEQALEQEPRQESLSAEVPPPVLPPPSPDDSDILDSQGLVILRNLFGSDDSLDAFSIPPDDPPDNSTPTVDDTGAVDDEIDMSSDKDSDDDDDDDDDGKDVGDDDDNDDDDNDDDDYGDAVAENETADHTGDDVAMESQPLFSSTEPSAESSVPPDSIQQEQSGFGPMRSNRRSSRRNPAPMPEPLLALHRRATHPAPVPSGRAARDISAVPADSLPAPPSTSPDHGNDPGPIT